MLKLTCCNDIRQFASPARAQLLRSIIRGFERECLRVTPQGRLATTPHPRALGSKLTHPYITTDYAEALLEFITPASSDWAWPLEFLLDVHRFCAQKLDGELLWAGSMPCTLGAGHDIAIADYGSSNQARFKGVYREGLGLRYGRPMQTIAGAHYNWSLPDLFWQEWHTCCQCSGPLQDFINAHYFGLIRNFLRLGWIIPYLFGASPALCRSFLQGRPSDLAVLTPDTLYGPYATSLRMSDLGYKNHAQASLGISFNSLTEYTRGLETAIRTPDPYYAELGVCADGHWRQLNDCLLQTESEYYAAMRPKRISSHGERPAKALHRFGVQYVEMRLFDLNPFIDIGISQAQCLFADVLLLTCLLQDSPPITSREQSENDENKRRVVTRGRQPGLHLLLCNRERPLQTLAHELFDDMAPVAAMLDMAYGGTHYAATLQGLRSQIDHPDTTLSAQVLDAVCSQGGFCKFAFGMSKNHTQSLKATQPDAHTQSKLQDSVQASWRAQQTLDAMPQGSFAEFVAEYYA